MECYNCGASLSESDFCNACGVDVTKYKKIMYTANRLYNDGLQRANVRDLSGAIASLRECLKFNKNHIDARNLLGLVYFEMGETVAGVAEWVISKNIRTDKNIADDYINMIQQNQSRLDTITSTIKKFNKSLALCQQESNDLAIIQLKKVLSLNPKYVKAHQLLALLYIEQEDYEKAERELERADRIDCGSLMTKRYQKEVQQVLHPVDEKNGKNKNSKSRNDSARTYKNGNEVIIQPFNQHEPTGIMTLVQIVIGIVIGLCVTYFVVLPSKIAGVKEDNAKEIAEYGEQIDKKNSEIEEYESRIENLEQTNLGLQDSLNVYEGANGAIDANNALIEAAYAYIDINQTDIQVEEYLDMITPDYIETKASPEYLALYNCLQACIGGSVSESYYTSGLEAYNQMNYQVAISDLGKAYLYDTTSDDALYYLAMAYYDSGDITNAKERFYELLNVFPESPLAEKASQRLEEIGE